MISLFFSPDPLSQRWRGLVLALVGLAALFVSSSRLTAETPVDASAGAEPVLFLLESISVEGVERAATREIVIQESRLMVGTEVAEDELRQAIYRIRRLPFVIDADFSLKKGSERGRYELVIRIEKATSVFVELEGFTNWSSDGSVFNEGELTWTGALGVRHFLGSRGYAFGSIDRFENARLGYTQFHLFGPGSYVSVSLNKNLDDPSDVYSVSLSAGKPITSRQVVRLLSSANVSELIDNRSVALEWAFDSTDDPLLPTRGEILSVSADYGESALTARFLDGLVFRSRTDSQTYSAFARKQWPVSLRQSVWGKLSAAENRTRSEVGTFNFRFTTRASAAELGYAWDLLRAQMGASRNDLRFALRASYSRQTTRGPFFEGGITEDSSQFDASVVFRRPQGSIRLVFSYLNDDAARPL